MPRAHLPFKNQERLFEHIFPVLLAAALQAHMAQQPTQQSGILKKMVERLPALRVIALQGHEEIGVVAEGDFFHKQCELKLR